MVKRTTAVLGCLLVCAALAWPHEEGFPEKTLKKIFPEAQSFASRTKKLTPPEISSLEKQLGEPLPAEDKNFTYYVALGSAGGQTRSLGIVLFVDTRGAKGAIDLAVGYDLSGSVRNVVVTENKDEKAVESDAFLKTLLGKTADQLVVARTENSPAKRAVAKAVRRGACLMQVLMASARR